MKRLLGVSTIVVVVCLSASAPIFGQLIDKNKAPNTSDDGISRPLMGAGHPTQIGSGRSGADGNCSQNVIRFDPFRAIRRGRQLFQRKFSRIEGQGAVSGDGFGNIDTDLAIGAGLADSCAACHGRPRGAAGFGGDVVTRPDSRDAPHLFGLGLKEMLADEITTDLRSIRDRTVAKAAATGAPVTLPLTSKGISYGHITSMPDGKLDTSLVEGVDEDLRVRPFFHHGGTISIREFVVGALKNEMGLAMANDPDLVAAKSGPVTTPSGMVLNGVTDKIEESPAEEGDLEGNVDARAALVDFLEFYLLNYFKAGLGEQTAETRLGQKFFEKAGCASCHIPNLRIVRDRRVADVDTMFDPVRGNFNRIFATARLLLANPSSVGHAEVEKIPARQPFMVDNFYSDLKRHDLGPGFHERNYDGTIRTHFLTAPLWGVAGTGPYGHDGRSISITDVILRHGGEAQEARDAFAGLQAPQRSWIVAFLNSLIVFPPDDTASNLDPGDRSDPAFPQRHHGSIRLTVLFNDTKLAE